MQLVSKKNWTLFLAALLVVLMGIMAFAINNTRKVNKLDSYEKEIMMMEEQSESDEIEAIENDLENTELEDIDRELRDIDNELQEGYL